MTTSATIDTLSPSPFTPDITSRPTPYAQGWSLATRIAFRLFCLVTVLYSVVQLWSEVLWRLPLPMQVGTTWQYTLIGPWWSPFVGWVGQHVFHVAVRGPAMGQLVGLFCVFFLASVGTAVWSVADRDRTEYRKLDSWLRVYCRVAAGVLLMDYGLMKVLITQADFPPAPSALLKPMGAFDPASFFFAYLATSPVYQAFAGAVELLAGILLIPRRTIALGALLAGAAMTNVIVINWAFHIAMFRISASVFIIAAFLLTPEIPRLADVLLFNRGVPPLTRRPLFMSRRLSGAAQAVGVCFLVGELAFLFHRDLTEGMHWRGRPPLYGAYVVESFIRDEAAAATSTGDDRRWVQLAVDPKPSLNQMAADAFGTIIAMHDTIRIMIRIDTVQKTMAIIPLGHPKQLSRWNYVTPDANHLVLMGSDSLVNSGGRTTSPQLPATNGSNRAPGGVVPTSLRITLRRLDLMAFPLLKAR